MGLSGVGGDGARSLPHHRSSWFNGAGIGLFFGLTRIPGKHHAKKLQKVVAAEAQLQMAEEARKTKEQQKQRWRQERDAREQKDAASRQSMLLRQAAQNTVLAANVSLDFES